MKVSLRSAFRLVAVVAALVCGWIAIAAEQRAHVPVCVNPMTGPRAPDQILCQRLPQPGVFPTTASVGQTWLVGPTVAMSLAIVAALAFALVAISPRQGTLLTYRWRRAVF